jgi:hypothetical protein
MRSLSSRGIFAGILVALALAMCTVVSGASAAPNAGPPTGLSPDGPQTANIPYVAWVGEHVRLVACDPAIDSDEGVQFVNYQVEDWSGYQFQPPTPDGDAGSSLGEIFDPGPAAFFSSSEPAHEGDGCVATDYKSLNPGLSRIRVVVRNEETDAVVFSHQFIVIWLTANAPVLHEAGLSASGSEVFQSELNGSGQANLEHLLGDSSGNGEFTPTPFGSEGGEDEGLVQVRVTGSFPVLESSPLSNILSDSSYTLPTDWATLAGVLSSSSEETEPPGTEPNLWDIHGTPGAADEGEETVVDSLGDPTEVCTSGSVSVDSSTDNCNGTGSEDPLTSKFSRVFGDLTSGVTATTGPFDPQAANETLLSDGRLNADDAPMPAMRIDVSIAKNTGDEDLGGVGQLSGASKAVIYSHDFTGASTAHNLYNPYYGAYIPATDRPGVSEASGVDGPSPGGDFPGFLNLHPAPYRFWTSVQSSNYRRSESTECLRREGDEPSEYETPSGPLTETFYTDERGEAYLTYSPGDEFYLNHLVSKTEEPGKIIKNADGGCDLKGVFGEVIGESSISATAIYPYEPVDYTPAKSATPLVKKVRSLWEKEFFQFKKGEGTNEQSVRIVVAKARDIDGSPFVNEPICFFAQGGGLSQFSNRSETVADPNEVLVKEDKGVAYIGGSVVVHPVGDESKFCETTNKVGLAAIEVTNSSLSPVDLNADYIEEGIIRDHDVVFTPEPEETDTVSPLPGSSPTVTVLPEPTVTPSTNLLVAPIASTTPVGSSGVAGATIAAASKPLTKLQMLHKALNACKKKTPKKARIACEQKARRAYTAKAKPKPAVKPAPPVIGLG